MKKINIILAIFITVFLYSCQDVVDIPLDTASPKLVIDASINWEKGTTGANQTVILTTTTNFYDKKIPVVSGAIVTIANSQNEIFNFIEKPNTGEYFCKNFVPVIDETYTLTVINKGETFTATESLKSVAKIETPAIKIFEADDEKTEVKITNGIAQEIQKGFTGDALKIRAFYKDPADVENYYMYQYKFSNEIKSNFFVDNDVFTKGNYAFSFTFKDKLTSGDKVQIVHYGISKSFYNYMNVLLSVAGSQGGGPFQSPPATVKGNIVNKTNFENYPLGYFRLSELSAVTHVVF
jgi:Domain of unknown function (DUF4249)